MTVKELIEKLQKCDSEAEVLMYNGEEGVDAIIEDVYQEQHRPGWDNSPYYVKTLDHYMNVESKYVVIIHNGGVSANYHSI